MIDKPRRARRGQSFVGLLVVLLILTLLTAFGAPRVDLTRFRSDSLARQAASVFSVAKRTSRQQRHDVLVRVDSAGKRLCTVADINGNGVRDPGEKETWTDLDSSTELLDPPSQLPTSPMPASGRRSLDVSRVTAPVVRGQVAFRRSGAANADFVLYLTSDAQVPTAWRAVHVSGPTGVVQLWRFDGVRWSRGRT